MAKQYSHLNPTHIEFIKNQKMYFVASATEDSRINVSPKGLDTLRVLNDNRLIWLNLTGSGNETAAHVLLNPRITIMFCAFVGNPLILRVYGNARVVHSYNEEWVELLSYFPEQPCPRQIFDVQIDLVQTSCGFGVPLFDSVADRSMINDWAEAKGPEGVEEYWAKKNQTSLDGLPTHILINSSDG
ncbi:MAG TPA: pyridoxamine 5'-phosphate oxidase family protein [Halothiobacillus sp.]|nr:pyridoxamine 5'-phosphate oxidase family protein [Halothiobacillus sp.]